LTTGYSLGHVDVNKLGINLTFTKSGVVEGKKWDWSPWLGLYDVHTSTPYKDDIVTTIVFADVRYFFLGHNPDTSEYPATWCVFTISRGPERNSDICLPSEADAHGLIDALATMVVASGGELSMPPGISANPSSDKDFRNHPERAGLQVSSVHSAGPAAQAGIQKKDIIRSINGTPCTKMDDLNSATQAAAEKPAGGDVHLELLRKGANLSIDVHYSHTEVNAAALRAQLAQRAQQQAAAPAAGPGAAPSGPQLGARVRAVTDADVTTFGLSKPKGVVVTSVEKDGLADEMQMQIGDVILEVNDSEIGDLQFFTQFVRRGAAKKFKVWRKGQAVELVVPENI
jgi:membrane-associated protease RseP (regulator of RpoE activity)